MVVSRVSKVILEIESFLEKYDAAKAVEVAEKFVVDDLSNWYVRRIRDRVGPTAVNSEDKNAAYETLWLVLTNISITLSPMMPFMTEEIYRNLTGNISVHLESWPLSPGLVNDDLESQMARSIQISGEVHGLRKKENIKVRQPLSQAEYSGDKLPDDIENLIATEVNVKKVINNPKINECTLETIITEELKAEGAARDIVRQIQEARKEANCELNAFVKVKLPFWPDNFEDYIKKETLASELIKGEKLEIVK